MPARLAIVACATLLALAATACGEEEPGVDEPAREGLALELGGVDYNVFITRQLNPAIPPDEAYVEGADVAPEADETLYGVFLEVCNPSGEPRRTATSFTVRDNQGNEFEPTPLPEDNPFAYHARRLEAKRCIPEAGSVAQLGPTAAAMLLFKLPVDATENRPLELEIENPGEGEPGHLTVELDL